MRSPVTGNDKKTVFRKSVDVKKIIGLYSEQGMDVKRFFSGIDKVDILECLDTGYRFYHPYGLAADDEFYDELAKKNGYYLDWRWEHQVSFEKILEHDSILEVGCGSGNFLQQLKERKSVSCVGLELSEEAAHTAESKGIKIFRETIENHAIENKSRYDVVCFFQVLEHVPDVRSFILSAIDCLKKGGRLIIGVPNNNPYLFKRDIYHVLNLPPHHMGLWNKESLKKLTDIFPLEIKEISVEPLLDVDYFWKVNLNYWRNKNGFLSYFLNFVPDRIDEKIKGVIRYFCSGRNILAIYVKR